MAAYEFTLTGDTAFIMHADNIMAADMLNEWRKNPANKSVSVPGDDRSPAWTWTCGLYRDDTHVALPQENVMACLKAAASRIVLQKQKSFKELSQAAMSISEEFCTFLINGKQVPMAAIGELAKGTFAQQFEAVKDLGFELFVKRAKIGTSKHVRVRPRFPAWSVKGVIETTDAALTDAVVQNMFSIAGRYIGLGDWRPGGKSPGPFGRFTPTLKAV